jgi:hypothetical protein
LNQKHILGTYLSLSLVGGVFLVVFAVLLPAPSQIIVLQDKILVAGAFITSCVFGISFAVHPNWIRQILTKKNDAKKKNSDGVKRMFQGHHPDCETFDNHRIQYQKKAWCAGCLGLLGGCLVSIPLMILYLLVPLRQSLRLYRVLIFICLILIVIVYVEVVRVNRHPLVHIISNGMLIPSFFLLTVSIVELSGKSQYGLFTILLCFLLLDARVQLSKWHHNRQCRTCPESCKVYTERLISGI